jgi:HAD superfamily hydrolase (TIGR01509 family)
VNVQALVFDFDGLILDTETSLFSVWCQVFQDHGCRPLTITEWSKEIGTQGGFDVHAELVSRATLPVDPDDVRAQVIAAHHATIEQEMVRPGVIEWLDEAHELELGVAIASSLPAKWVDGHLTRLGLREHFSYLACWCNELEAKPAPDTYLAACAALGVEPQYAIALEDSPHGIAAARAAGLRVIAVPNPVTAQLDVSAADVVLDSLAAHDLTDIIGVLD